MPDDEQVAVALQSMRAALRPGGLLVLTQGTTDKQWAQRPRFLLAFDRPEMTRLFVIDYHGPGARYNIVDIDRACGEPDIKVWGVDYACVLLGDDYERLLKSAAFLDVALYGSYDGAPYDRHESDRLIVVARR
jgi:hypothetical protein